jgi:iron complex transport system ATP-binding protein
MGMTAAVAPDVRTRLPRGGVLLEARDIDVTIGPVPILRSVDFTVRAGELVALVGPNGSGKSTLLGVLSGDLPPTRGDVDVCARPLESWSALELARLRAVLPQMVTMSFPFLVRDIVSMGRAPWQGTPLEDDDDAAVIAALQATDSDMLAKREFPTLSGGERARVSLARILAQDVQTLLLDEPTAALDVKHQELVLRILRDQVARDAGVVVVLHDLELAAAYADRIVVLSRGAVRSDGAPAEVLDPALLSEVYEHEIEVIRHPETGERIILPRRNRRA